MSDRRDFLETVRTAGWDIYEERINYQIRKKSMELAKIDTDGKTAEQIGLEHLKLEREIDGMKQTLKIADIIKIEPADDM